MAWALLPRQQQRGAQLHNREIAGQKAQAGGAPAEAVKDRDAQQHDYADLQVGAQPRSDIDYPTDSVPDRQGDITPTLPDDATQTWDDVVQPEKSSAASHADHGQQPQGQDDLPLPEGK